VRNQLQSHLLAYSIKSPYLNLNQAQHPGATESIRHNASALQMTSGEIAKKDNYRFQNLTS
jgi:hypothetical protein